MQILQILIGRLILQGSGGFFCGAYLGVFKQTRAGPGGPACGISNEMIFVDKITMRYVRDFDRKFADMFRHTGDVTQNY